MCGGTEPAHGFDEVLGHAGAASIRFGKPQLCSGIARGRQFTEQRRRGFMPALGTGRFRHLHGGLTLA